MKNGRFILILLTSVVNERDYNRIAKCNPETLFLKIKASIPLKDRGFLLGCTQLGASRTTLWVI